MSTSAVQDPGSAALDQRALTPIVRTLLNNNFAEVVYWRSTPILQGKASPFGVFRIAGIAQAEDTSVPWSLVLKQVRASAQSAHAGNHASDDPTRSYYWKREPLLYESGLFDTLPDGFAAPHCYRLDELTYGCNIWMEEVREGVGEVWPLDHYGHVARHFGRFNGSYLAACPLPTWPWLLTGQLARRVRESDWEEFAPRYAELRRTDALVRRGWSDELFAEFERIWQDRGPFLQALARLPQTLLHNDAGRRNLIARRRPKGGFETVAVDWGAAAIGPIGEDLTCLVTQPTYWFSGVHPDQLPELDALAFEGYVQGLRDAGWHGDPALARLGYTASVALRAGFGIFLFEWAARNENTRSFIETGIGHPIEEIADVMRGLRTFIVTCAQEARQLIASLPSA